MDAPENERELEALAIAGKIRSMVGHDLVLDKETGEYRPVRYGDIVILLRSATGWAETFGKCWLQEGFRPIRRPEPDIFPQQRLLHF